MGWGTVCFHLHTEVLQAHKHIWPVSLNLSDILISKKHRGSLPFQALWALLWSAVFIHRPDTTQWKTITFFFLNHRLGSFSKWSQHYSFAMKLFFLSISLHIQELGMQAFARVVRLCMFVWVYVVPANGVSSMHWLLLRSTWHTLTVLLTRPDRSASCISRRGKHFKMCLKLWWVGR